MTKRGIQNCFGLGASYNSHIILLPIIYWTFERQYNVTNVGIPANLIILYYLVGVECGHRYIAEVWHDITAKCKRRMTIKHIIIIIIIIIINYILGASCMFMYFVYYIMIYGY